MEWNDLPESLKAMTPELLEAFVDNPYECPIVIDKDGIVRFMSRFNEGLYKVSQKDAVGKHIAEIVKNTKMPQVLRTQKAQIGKAMKLGNKVQIIARIPLKDREGNLIGGLAKLMFHQPEKIKDLYYQLEILREQVEYYKRERKETAKGGYHWEAIVGDSPLIAIAKREALKAASSDAPVLITGESGTGKELFSCAIHYSSRRADGPFIKVNCAAIPHDLMESELFGYEPGAFTGARSKGKPGRFELANGGTIFLDEIGDMPLATQAKILRVIQEKEIERLGSTRPLKVDFRVIAATNKELSLELKRGTFRQDLYFRLNTFHLNLPPLREMKADIPKLAYYFLSSFRDKTQKGPIKISREVLELFTSYSWPGNIRELRNVIERAVYVAEGEEITLRDLPKELVGFYPGKKQPILNGERPLKEAITNTEKIALLEALDRAKGNKTLAARLLGIHRTGLYAKLKKYGLTRP